MNNLALSNVNVAPAPIAPVNVVGINNNSASVKIQNYLEDKKRKSESTYKAYNRYYKELFMFTCNKKINEVTWEDIFNITYSKVDEFKSHLLNIGVKPNYVNQKLFACKSLWEKLYHIDRNVDMRVFDFEEEDYEETNFASLNESEINLLFDLCDTYNYKPLTRRMFFEFLYYIGSRKNVPLELKWDDIQNRYDNKSGLNVWVIRYKDKGKWVEKAINDDFYSKIFKLKEESFGEKVFQINSNTINDTFKDFRDKYDLHEKNGKRVVIHSIKKASGWLVQNTFNDIAKTQKHLQHQNNSTTTKIYINDEDYTDQASYLIGKDIDVNFFKSLDEGVLLQLIENCGRDVQMKIYYEYMKMSGSGKK